MFGEMLDGLINDGFRIGKCTIDKDASCQEVLLEKNIETEIFICGNHRAKTFHADLENVKKTPCQCKQMGRGKCKRMTDGMIGNSKRCLSNLLACPDITSSDDPLGDFADALQNYYNHQNIHTSQWCRYHRKVTTEGVPCQTKHAFNWPDQLKAFKNLLTKMAAAADEYITLDGRMTNNIVEGFHNIALVYREKRMDLAAEHYSCKTNMLIPHKNIGPIWKLLVFTNLDIPVPIETVQHTIQQQNAYDQKKIKRQEPEHKEKGNKFKKDKLKQHKQEKDHMEELKAVKQTGIYGATCKDAGLSDISESDQEMEWDSKPICEVQTLAKEESNHEKSLPLFFIYDCEGTGGVVYTDHIVEIAAAVQPLSAGVLISSPLEFQTLVNTSKRIAPIVSKKCGLKRKDLLQKPKLSEVLPKFVKWIEDVVQEVRNATDKNYSPAILVHNGFVYDYPILMAEIDRRQGLLTQNILSKFYFGDTLEHIRKVHPTIFTL